MAEIDLDTYHSMEPYESGPMEIKKEDVLAYCRYTGDTEPLCTDEDAARAGPYGVLVAPHMFPYTLGVIALPRVRIVSGIELFGGIELEYLEPLKVGDRVTATCRITDITQKKGRSGEMFFISREAEIKNQESRTALFVRHRMVVLDRKVT
jgi:acyl dehydratase